MEYSESAYRRRFLPGAAAGSQAGFASSSSSIRGGTGLTGAVSSSTSSSHKDPLVRAASLAPTAPPAAKLLKTSHEVAAAGPSPSKRIPLLDDYARRGAKKDRRDRLVQAPASPAEFMQFGLPIATKVAATAPNSQARVEAVANADEALRAYRFLEQYHPGAVPKIVKVGATSSSHEATRDVALFKLYGHGASTLAGARTAWQHFDEYTATMLNVESSDETDVDEVTMVLYMFYVNKASRGTKNTAASGRRKGLLAAGEYLHGPFPASVLSSEVVMDACVLPADGGGDPASSAMGLAHLAFLEELCEEPTGESVAGGFSDAGRDFARSVYVCILIGLRGVEDLRITFTKVNAATPSVPYATVDFHCSKLKSTGAAYDGRFPAVGLLSVLPGWLLEFCRGRIGKPSIILAMRAASGRAGDARFAQPTAQSSVMSAAAFAKYFKSLFTPPSDNDADPSTIPPFTVVPNLHATHSLLYRAARVRGYELPDLCELGNWSVDDAAVAIAKRSARSVIHYGRDNPALARSAEVRYRIMADLRSVLDDSDWTTVFPTSDDTILEMDCLLERVGSDDD